MSKRNEAAKILHHQICLAAEGNALVKNSDYQENSHVRDMCLAIVDLIIAAAKEELANEQPTAATAAKEAGEWKEPPTPLFGDLHKKLRIERGVTLQEHCLARGLDNVFMSKLERNLAAPGSYADIRRYASALGLTSDENHAFFRSAQAANVKLSSPPASEQELLDRLPFLGLALKGKTAKEIDAFIAMLQEA